MIINTISSRYNFISAIASIFAFSKENTFYYYICLLKNYYKILNLDFNTTLAEVKTAYRKLAHLYHPDKTDNELLKQKFADIKEAYEILRDPVKRKNYDLTFDNFSYKKEEFLTPYQLLQKAKAINIKTSKLDPYRMNLDRLEFEITEILSERNINTLQKTQDKAIVQVFIEEILALSKPLTPAQFKFFSDHLTPLADEASKEKMKLLLQTHTWSNRWNSYKLVFAIVAGVILCVIIYFSGK